MNKETSNILKGTAILLMIFLHLFNNMSNVELCSNFVYMGGIPLIYRLSSIAHLCVPIYLFLSGYGLYKSKEHSSLRRNILRIKKLYINYWVVLAIFVFAGAFIRPDIYLGSTTKFISNITAYKTTYNNEWWFLLPYVILVLISPGIFKVIDKLNWKLLVCILPLIHFIAFATIKFNGPFLFSHQYIYYLVLIPSCSIPFTVGALIAKYKVIERLKESTKTYRTICLITLLAVLFLKTIFRGSFFNDYSAVPFILLFAAINRGKVLDAVLAFFGKHSTNMWLIHSFFCYYLFHDFIYGFRFPIVIFVVTTLLSLACSYVVMFILRLIYSIKPRVSTTTATQSNITEQAPRQNSTIQPA